MADRPTIEVRGFSMITLLGPEDSVLAQSVPLLYVDPTSELVRQRRRRRRGGKRRFGKPLGLTGQVVGVKRGRVGKRVKLDVKINDTVYALRVPDAWLRVGHLINSQPTLPLFVLATDALLYDEDAVYNMADFDVAILPPAEDSKIEKRFTRAVVQTVTQYSPMFNDFSETAFTETRSQVVDILTKLVNGDPRGIVEAYAFINPYNHFVKNGPARQDRYSHDEQKLTHVKNHLSRLLTATSPAAVYLGSSNTPEPATEVAALTQFDAIMRQNGLDDSFAALLANAEAKPQLANNLTEQIAHLSQPLTVLPQKMQELQDKIGALPYLNKIWEAEDTDTLLESGDDLAGAFLVIATRLGRLEESGLSQQTTIHPSFVLMQAMTLPGEANYAWALQDMLRLYLRGHQASYRDLLAAATDEAEGPSLLMSPLGGLYHNFGHAVLREEISPEQARMAFAGTPLVASFLDSLYENAAANDEENCEATEAAASLFQLGFSKQDLADQIAQAAGILAEIVLLKSSELTPVAPEWSDKRDAWIGRRIIQGDFS